MKFVWMAGVAMYGQPAFEVATIKPAPPYTTAMAGTIHYGMTVDRARVDIGYSSLAELIRIAYQVKPYQISGPAWMSDQKWDVLAKIPDGVPPSQVPQMLQALLTERFGLKMHRETHERKIYGLEIGKGGSKLKESASDEDKPLDIATSRDGKSTVVTGGGYGVTKTEMRPDGSMHLAATSMTTMKLADALAYYLDRPVIDMTRLTGSYAMEIDYSAADLRYAAAKEGYAQTLVAGDDPVGVSLIASIEKLGLRLTPQQAPIEIIVVDQLEKAPTAN